MDFTTTTKWRSILKSLIEILINLKDTTVALKQQQHFNPMMVIFWDSRSTFSTIITFSIQLILNKSLKLKKNKTKIFNYISTGKENGQRMKKMFSISGKIMQPNVTFESGIDVSELFLMMEWFLEWQHCLENHCHLSQVANLVLTSAFKEFITAIFFWLQQIFGRISNTIVVSFFI